MILPVRQPANPVDTPQDFSYTSLDQTFSTHAWPVHVSVGTGPRRGKLRCAISTRGRVGRDPSHAGLSSRRSWVAQALGCPSNRSLLTGPRVAIPAPGLSSVSSSYLYLIILALLTHQKKIKNARHSSQSLFSFKYPEASSI